MKIAPGVRVNLGKRGASVTVGGKLGRVTMGPSGTHVGASVPGTGVYMTQKVGTSQSKPARSGPSPHPTVQYTSVSALLRSIPPQESGTTGVISAIAQNPKRQALAVIAKAAASPSPESDVAVERAVQTAPDSWTVRREAGMYCVARGNPAAAVAHLAEAANRFPGDRTLYYLVAADAAIDAGNFDYARSALEPYIQRSDPNDDIGGLIFVTLAHASHQSGDSGRALELLSRLPLRKQNLSQTLLYGLCVRACANRALGKKAQAKKDIDRVYANQPDFPMLEAAAAEALAE